MKRLLTWWDNRRNEAKNEESSVRPKRFQQFTRAIGQLSRSIIRLIVIGMILHMDGFPEAHPVLYGLFEGSIQFVEFVISTILISSYSLFTGNFLQFWTSTWPTEFLELLQQFITWVSMLHF